MFSLLISLKGESINKGRKAILCVLVASVFVMPIRAVKNERNDLLDIGKTENHLSDDLDSYIISEMGTWHIPGLSAYIVMCFNMSRISL